MPEEKKVNNGRNVSLGIYNTDGDLVSGMLHGYREIARRLAESNVTLYVQFRGDEAIFGTAVNVQRTGRRPDTVIVLIRAAPLRYGADTGRIIVSFYREAVDALEHAEYSILNIGNDEELLQTVRAQRPLIPAAGSTAAERISTFVAGKLIATQKAYCTSRDLQASVMLVSSVIEVLIPVLRLGYTFACSKKTFEANLSILPDKPPNIPAVDIELDTRRIVQAGDSELYREFASALSDPTLTNLHSKHDLSRTIANAIYKRTRDKDLKKRYLQLVASGEVPVDVEVTDAIESVLQQRQAKLFEQYMKSRNFSRSAVKKSLERLNSSEQQIFRDVLNRTPGAPEKWRAISDILTPPPDRRQDIANHAGWSGEIPVRRGTRWPAVIVAALLLAALILSAVVLLGILPSPGTVPGTNGNDEPLLIASGDGMADVVAPAGGISGNDGVAPSIEAVVPPQDFIVNEGWKPVGLFYRITPDTVLFNPPARLSILLPPELNATEMLVIARNVRIGGEWERMETDLTVNNTVEASVGQGGLYGVFTIPMMTSSP
ncbi:MAG: hypothetical protein APR53_00780 [Methanoculleus sp. SDB]|nr:MAG: hypothetical protein APR53_00780 [Methanoculleus sp. SDB]